MKKPSKTGALAPVKQATPPAARAKPVARPTTASAPKAAPKAAAPKAAPLTSAQRAERAQKEALEAKKAQPPPRVVDPKRTPSKTLGAKIAEVP